MPHNISGYFVKRSLVKNLTNHGIQYETYLHSPHFRRREMVLGLLEHMLAVSRLAEEVKLDILESGKQEMVGEMPD
jgi:hypothetical protein